MKRIALAIAVPMLAMTAAVSAAAPAMAAAVITRVTTTFTAYESGLPDDCRPGITGVLSGTDVLDLQSVETTTGFHVIGTDTFTGRIDFSDGSYSIIESVDHFSYYTTGTQTTIFTRAHEDSGNTYSASGVFLSRGTFHLVQHITTSGGVTRVTFERGHFHFSGDC